MSANQYVDEALDAMGEFATVIRTPAYLAYLRSFERTATHHRQVKATWSTPTASLYEATGGTSGTRVTRCTAHAGSRRT